MKKLRLLVLSLSILLGSSMCVSADTAPKESSIIKYEESKESNERVLENVKVNNPITIEFNNEIDTKDKNCVYAFEKDNEKLIDVKVIFGENEKELIVTPNKNYEYDTEYIVYIINLKYKDNSSSIFDMYNFKTEKYVEKKEEKNDVANIEKKDDKVNQPNVEKKTEVKENTKVSKNPKSLEERVKELTEEINKLPAQFHGIGPDFRIDEKYIELFPGGLEKCIPKKEEWIWISNNISKELYEYPYMKTIEDDFWTNKRLYNHEPAANLYSMPGKYTIEDKIIPLAKGYFESKYTYDYRNQNENMWSVLAYTKSGCPMGYSKNEKKLYPDDIYKIYLENFNDEKIVSTAEFITDSSLVYQNFTRYIIRGTLRIKYIEGTSQEFLDKYQLKKDTWYEIDKEAAFVNMSEDKEKWDRWETKSVNTMIAEYTLSGLRLSKVEMEEE